MADIVHLAVVVAFFALCALYIAWCDRIVGPDEPVEAAGGRDETAETSS